MFHRECAETATYALTRCVESLRQVWLGIGVGKKQTASKAAATAAATGPKTTALPGVVASPVSSPVAAATPTTAAAVWTSPAQSPVPGAAAEWACEVCTFINGAFASVCGVCETKRTASAAATAPLTSSTEATPTQQAEAAIAEGTPVVAVSPESNTEDASWTCEVCTYLNATAAAHCEMCEAANPTAPSSGVTSSSGVPAGVPLMDSLMAQQLSFGDENAVLAAMLGPAPWTGHPTAKAPFKAVPKAEVLEDSESDADDDAPSKPKVSKMAVKASPAVAGLISLLGMPPYADGSSHYLDDAEHDEDEYTDEEYDEGYGGDEGGYEVSGGVGYAGSAHDSNAVARAAERARIKAARRDTGVACIFKLVELILARLADGGLRMPAGGDSAVLNAILGPGYADGLTPLKLLPKSVMDTPKRNTPTTTLNPSIKSAADLRAMAAAAAKARLGIKGSDEPAVPAAAATSPNTSSTNTTTATAAGSPAPSAMPILEPAFTSSDMAEFISRAPKKHCLSGRDGADGVGGNSVLHLALCTYLRNSMIDLQSGTSALRDVFFAMIAMLQSLTRVPGLLHVLFYTAPTAPGSSWAPPTDNVVAAERVVYAEANSIVALLQGLQAKAAAYNKASTIGGGGSALLAGSDDAVFLQVLGLASDIQVTYERLTKAIGGWAGARDGTTSAHVEAPGDWKLLVRSAGAAAITPAGGAPSAASALPEQADDEDMYDGLPGYGRGRRKARAPPTMSSHEWASALHHAATVCAGDVPGTDSAVALPSAAATRADDATTGSAVAPAAAGPTHSSTLTTHVLCASISPDDRAGSAAGGDVVSKYVDFMRAEAYNTVENLAADHALVRERAGADEGHGYYRRGPAPAAMGATKRLMRVSAEMAGMADLAVSWSSSIVVRTDEGSMDLMRAFIVGPVDTPYMNGFYGFDIKLPDTYPNEAPKVEFLTTGGGDVRFNPNLYAEGKVCLSLLGTWSGPGWIPGESTLAQVLLSIQSQILVDVPYANEPSYERRVNTAAGRRAVAMHNTQLRLANIRWAMLEVLRRPPSGFERAVQAHFYLKRDEIKTQCARWLQETQALADAESGARKRHEAALRALRAALELELAVRDEYLDFVTQSQIPSHEVFGWNMMRAAAGGRAQASSFDLLASLGLTDVAIAKGVIPAPVATSASAAAEASRTIDAARLKVATEKVYAGLRSSKKLLNVMGAKTMQVTAPPTVAAAAVLDDATARARVQQIVRNAGLPYRVVDFFIDTVAAGAGSTPAAHTESGAAATPAAAHVPMSGGASPAFPIRVPAANLCTAAGLAQTTSTIMGALHAYNGKPASVLVRDILESSPTHAWIQVDGVSGPCSYGYEAATAGWHADTMSFMNAFASPFGSMTSGPRARGAPAGPAAPYDPVKAAQDEVAAVLRANQRRNISFDELLTSMKAAVLALCDALDSLTEPAHMDDE